MRLTFSTATEADLSADLSAEALAKVEASAKADAVAIAALRTATANHLTEQYGHGPWSGKTTDKGARLLMRTSRVLIARQGTEIVATLSLSTKKPWAILHEFLDPNAPRHFTIVKRPLYLTNMAVAPAKQRQGIGRRLLKEAAAIARAWPADLPAVPPAVAALAKRGAPVAFPAEAIRLDSYDADAGAGPFYAKCGYREIGRATYRKAPLIYFELLL